MNSLYKTLLFVLCINVFILFTIPEKPTDSPQKNTPFREYSLQQELESNNGFLALAPNTMFPIFYENNIAHMKTTEINPSSRYYSNTPILSDGTSLTEEKTVQNIKSLKKDMKTISAYQGQIKVHVSKELLQIMDGDILDAAILSALETPGVNKENLPSELFIVSLKQSQHLFEDKKDNQVVGINQAILNMTDQRLQKKLLQVGMAHELAHEFTGRNDDEFEEEQKSRDIANAYKLQILPAEIRRALKEISLNNDFAVALLNYEKQQKKLEDNAQTSSLTENLRFLPFVDALLEAQTMAKIRATPENISAYSQKIRELANAVISDTINELQENKLLKKDFKYVVEFHGSVGQGTAKLGSNLTFSLILDESQIEPFAFNLLKISLNEGLLEKLEDAFKGTQVAAEASNMDLVWNFHFEKISQRTWADKKAGRGHHSLPPIWFDWSSFSDERGMLQSLFEKSPTAVFSYLTACRYGPQNHLNAFQDQFNQFVSDHKEMIFTQITEKVDNNINTVVDSTLPELESGSQTLLGIDNIKEGLYATQGMFQLIKLRNNISEHSVEGIFKTSSQEDKITKLYKIYQSFLKVAFLERGNVFGMSPQEYVDAFNEVRGIWHWLKDHYLSDDFSKKDDDPVDNSG